MNCSIDNAITINVGDTFSGTLQLRKSANGIVNPFPVTGYSVIEVHFPPFANTAPVILSTANEGEIAILDGTLSTITFTGAPAKSALLNPGNMQKIDIIITDSAGNITTLTSAPVVNIVNRANA